MDYAALLADYAIKAALLVARFRSEPLAARGAAERLLVKRFIVRAAVRVHNRR